jgi:hypothetical protein
MIPIELLLKCERIYATLLLYVIYTVVGAPEPDVKSSRYLQASPLLDVTFFLLSTAISSERRTSL